MTSSPPPEARHFRGKTLTPESPVPVHIPEPYNIPVLRNQIDPIFNLMSTHMAQPSPSQGSNMGGLGEPNHLANGIIQASVYSTSEPTQANDETHESVNSDYYRRVGREYVMAYTGENSTEQQEPNTLQNHLSSNTKPSMSHGIHEPLSIPTQKHPTPVTSIQNQSPNTNIPQAAAKPFEQFQNVPVSQDPSTPVTGVTGKPATSQLLDSSVNGEGVNYQALLDNLSPSTSTSPTAENISSITTAAPSGIANISSPSNAQAPIATIPIPAGLPPRPPPQEKPAMHPRYTPGEDIRSYHNPPTQNGAIVPSITSQPSNSYRPPQGYPQQNGVAPNGLPPPPLATFQQSASRPNQLQRSPQTPQGRQKDEFGRNARQTLPDFVGEDEYPRRPDVERQYDDFLRDEAIYVSEGTWDKFPQGSRLFVGNLHTEKVTKRDLFYVFHKYGRLAQISMKNAYGFIQYHDANNCYRALQTEQGVEIRGRKTHLEISKPQKNSRNAAATAAGDSLRAGFNGRSRSPDYGRGSQMHGGVQRPGGDRFDRSAPPNSFERRVRDDYRPMRSPSPRAFRGRDEYRGGRERSPDRYFGGRRSRSRSPFNRSGRYRSRSPRPRNPDDEADLPIARRDPQDVPDVQIILVDEVDRTFVAYIQQSFRDRGLRCDVFQLPRVSLPAVVKRQIIEGVQAVVKILRKSQVTGKIPLQVFDRSSGVENIRFDEYDDLDANVAAELVARAKSTHLAPPPPTAHYPNVPTYGAPQYPQPPQSMQPQQPPPGGAPPNLANLITSLDGPALQKLLGAMAQTPQSPLTPQQPPRPQPSQEPAPPQTLASLLRSVASQQQSQQGYQYSGAPQQAPQQQNTYPSPAPNPSFANNTALSSLLNNAGSRLPPQGLPPQQQQPGHPQNVQNVMHQLAQWKQ